MSAITSSHREDRRMVTVLRNTEFMMRRTILTSGIHVKTEAGLRADLRSLLGTRQVHNAEENEQNQLTALWVNAVGGWVAFLLFAWIRLAPRCCPSRDFSAA